MQRKQADRMQVRMLQSTAGQVGAGRMQGRCRNLPAWQLTRLLTLVTSGECTAQGNLASTFISPMETMKIEQLQHSQCLTSRMRFPLAQSTTFTWTVGLPEHDLVLFKNHCWKKWEIYRYLFYKSYKLWRGAGGAGRGEAFKTILEHMLW